jgi:hypothetical protein
MRWANRSVGRRSCPPSPPPARVTAASTESGLAALLLLYGRVLQRRLAWMDRIVRAKRPERPPGALSRVEVRGHPPRRSGTLLV